MKALRQQLTILAMVIIVTAISQTASGTEPESDTDSTKILTHGLNHVGLTVRDLDASTAFFTETLNWDLAGGYPDYPSKFVTDGEIFVTLWQASEPANAIAFDRKNNIGLHHLALTVVSFEALDELHARFLETEGVVIEFSPELNGSGPTRHMMIREPSGNRIEFAHTPTRK